MPHTVIVVAKSGAWLVKSDERMNQTRLFSTQKNAIAFARGLAKDIRGELVIQTKIGKIGA